MVRIEPERPEHAAAIEQLLNDSFGPGRFAKTVYRLREGVAPIAPLSTVGIDEDGKLIGSLRYWPVMIDGRHEAIMLGPLAVDPARRSNGIGQKLMDVTLARAAELGHRICVLVGDEPYYAKAGFQRALAQGLALPGPVDPARLLAKELAPGSMTGVAGLIHRVRLDEKVAASSTALTPPRKKKAA